MLVLLFGACERASGQASPSVHLVVQERDWQTGEVHHGEGEGSWWSS